MKLIAIAFVLIAACTIQCSFASKKVTASITVTGLTVAELNDKSAKILDEIATLLDVDASKVVSEGDAAVSVATTSAPTGGSTTTIAPGPSPTTTSSVSAAPVSAAPTTAAPSRRMLATDERRRLNGVVFTFSVIVATTAEATALKTKLESTAFKTNLITKLDDIYTGKTISVEVSTPTVDDYTTTTAAPAKKAAVSAGVQVTPNIMGIFIAFLALFVIH
jgi:hypothetical protein